MYCYYNKRVIVLIDEYDAPIHAAYLHGYYDKMVEFIRGFFGNGLKDNPLLEKAVLTGILRVSKESIFSEFNNVTCYTLLDEGFGDKFGLIEEEVNSLLREFDIPSQLDEIRAWYNGYFVGGFSLYNPWSVIQCIQSKGKLQPYWVNTSSNELIKKLIWNGTGSLKQDIEKLLYGESIVKNIQEGIVFSDLKSQEDSIWSLFFFFGYLTLTKESGSVGSLREIKIPNKEVCELYQSMVQNWLTEYLPSSDVSEMLQSLITGQIEVFSDLFETLVLQVMSSHDFPRDSSEKIYQAFVLGLLVALEKTHEVKSNLESGHGRYVVCLIPKKSGELGIIIEFKKGKKEDSLQETAKEALKQIEEKKYAVELKSRGVTRIVNLAIVF